MLKFRRQAFNCCLCIFFCTDNKWFGYDTQLVFHPIRIRILKHESKRTHNYSATLYEYSYHWPARVSKELTDRLDLLLDLAVNLETRRLLKWCHDHNVCFVNTSVELWDPFGEAHRQDPRLLTLYHRQMQLVEMQNDKQWKNMVILDKFCK